MRTLLYFFGIFFILSDRVKPFSTGLPNNVLNQTIKSFKVKEHLPKLKQEEFEAEFDWRDNHYMPPVTDQLDCSSCWAHAAGAALNAYIAHRHRKGEKETKFEISIEELIDYTGRLFPNNDGCNGGLARDACDYVRMQNIHFAKDYPLRKFYGDSTPRCRLNDSDLQKKPKYPSKGLKLGYPKRIDFDDEPAEDKHLQYMLKKYGPIAVRIFWTPFKLYRGGILKNVAPNPIHHTHAFVLIGWGHDEKENIDYWLVRNSWSTHWGEAGYARIQRGINSIGIDDYASYLM